MTPHSDQWLADSLERVEGKTDKIEDMISRIDREGCNQRAGDLIKINHMTDELAAIKKVLDRIYWTVLTILGSGVAYFLEQLIMHRGAK